MTHAYYLNSRFFSRNPNPSPNKSEENGLKFKWTNYTEYNQDFAVLGLKSYMKKYFLTERYQIKSTYPFFSFLLKWNHFLFKIKLIFSFNTLLSYSETSSKKNSLSSLIFNTYWKSLTKLPTKIMLPFSFPLPQLPPSHLSQN